MNESRKAAIEMYGISEFDRQMFIADQFLGNGSFLFEYQEWYVDESLTS